MGQPPLILDRNTQGIAHALRATKLVLAQGKLDACIIFANKPGDTSGGVLIAREAGAIATDIAGNPHQVDSGTTVVASPEISGSILRAIRTATDSLGAY